MLHTLNTPLGLVRLETMRPTPLALLLAAGLVLAAAPPASALAADRYTITMWHDGSGDHYDVLDSSGASVAAAWGCSGVIASPTGSGVEVRCTPGAVSCADPSVTAKADTIYLGGFPLIFPMFPPRLQVNGNCQNASGPSPAVGSCTATYGAPCTGSAVGTITGSITAFCHAIPSAFTYVWDASCSFDMA